MSNLGKFILPIAAAILLAFIVPEPLTAAQQSGRRISLDLENVPLSAAIELIEEQSEYLFINKGADVTVKISCRCENVSVQEACTAVFGPVGIAFEIRRSSIIISVPEKIRVSGTVSDSAGEPVPGVAVIEKGTSNGCTTGLDGTFEIEVRGSASVLVFTSLGYETINVTVGERSSISVVMQEESVSLEGTVVTALGIRRDEKALSYNVQQISSEALTTVKDANFMNSLAGKVAGLAINSSSSGVGGASKVVLRGNKSITQSSNALYVIDGIPMYNFGGGGGTEFDSKGETESIADLNPDDIESISVLTGAAAAALYGSEAANGAVMITTRQGEAGKLKVTFSSNTDFLSPFVLPEFQNRYGTGLNGNREASPVYSWGPKLSVPSGYDPTDFLETGHVYTNSITLSGGTDRNRTYFSAAAVNSDGMVPNNRYDRYNFTFRNTTFFLQDRLKLDAGASYIWQTDQNMVNQGVYSNPLVPAYLFPRGENFDIYRIYERYNPSSRLMEMFWSESLEGDNLRMQNPYWIAYRNPRNNDRKRYMLSLNISYDILDWLSLSGRVKIDNSNNLYTQKLYASSNRTITEGSSNGFYAEARSFDTQTYADIMANIDRTFGGIWTLNAHIGASVNNIKTDELSYRGPIRENGLPNIFNVFDLDDVKKRAEKSGWQEQTRSIFASVEAGWNSQLYLTLTGRNDWASQLAGSSQSSFFYPSAGLSWVPSVTWDLGKDLTYLKIRTSVASVGLPFPRYLTMPSYKYDPVNKIWETKSHYPIGDLKPERTMTYEAGIEASLWDRLNFNISWYMADTYNQTFDPALPPSSSYSTIYLQTGHVRNTGVEASAGYSDSWESGLSWNSSFTFSWNRNEIIDLASGAVNPVTGEPLNIDKLNIKGLGKAKYVLKQGGTLGDLYTSSDLKRDSNGYIEVDSNGNFVVIDDGKDLLLGSVFPDYLLAWRNDLSFKGFRLGILFSGRIGGVCYSATQANLDLFGVSEASAAARDAGGVLINGRAMADPQKWYQSVGANSGLPQFYTYSATNFRLQELSFGYTFPRRWFRDRLGLTLSFVGKNLWMIWCRAPFDPEAVASTGLNYQGIDYFMMPSTRNLGASLKLEF